jgi:hypothetical protein
VHVHLDGKLMRLSGSISNIHRNNGGNAYYCIPSSDVNIPCQRVDQQISQWLSNLSIPAELVKVLRETYQAEVGQQYASPTDEITRLTAALETLEAEEMRASRLYASGKLTDTVWDRLWQELQTRRMAIKQQIALLGQPKEVMIDNLDDALDIFSQLPKLYGTLSPDEQQQLLHFLVKKVIVDPEGTILQLELHPPFAYLANQGDRLKKRLSKQNVSAAQMMGGAYGTKCSEYVRLCGEGGIRTREGVTLTRVPGERTSPLCDLSLTKLSYSTIAPQQGARV